MLIPISQVHNYGTRSATSGKLFKHHINTDKAARSLSFRAPTLWNELPREYQEAESAKKCRDAVYNVKTVCEQEEVEPPVLVSESGRAVLAYHAVTVVTPLKVIGRDSSRPVPIAKEGDAAEPAKPAPGPSPGPAADAGGLLEAKRRAKKKQTWEENQ